MKLKPGYKQTEVGVIPDDWLLTTLGATCDFENGDRSSNYPPPGSFVHSGVPFINAGHLADGRIDMLEMDYISPDRYHKLGGGKVRPGDILFCLRGSLGKYGLVNDDFGLGAIASSLVIIRPRRPTLDLAFLTSYLGSSLCRRMIAKWAGGAAQPNLGAKDLSRFLLALPPTAPEQRAIATALSDVDALLRALDRLIAKKRDLKQAAMQQLLTGQTRLPGFSGEWEVKRLGDHLTFLKHGVNSRAELTAEGEVKYLHYGDIHGAAGLLLNPSATRMPHLPILKASRLDRLSDGDLVFADASEDLDGVGKSVELYGVEGTEVVSGLHTIAVRFDKEVLADGFKAYLQFVPVFRQHLRRLAAGTKVYATNRAHIASVEMKLPSAREQTAIAAVLSDMDAEIEALEARCTKTRDLKQAMMQELLTGRTRLAAPQAAPQTAPQKVAHG